MCLKNQQHFLRIKAINRHLLREKKKLEERVVNGLFFISFSSTLYFTVPGHVGPRFWNCAAKKKMYAKN